jgi:prevent-host-death family protein
MPVIKPISDLRNKANQISDLAETIDEPIFITRNGEGDMVVMSMAQQWRRPSERVAIGVGRFHK